MRRTSGRVGVGLVLASLLLAAGGTAAADARVAAADADQWGSPTSTPATAAATARVAVELYRRGAFVSQTNLVQCVGASMQMMLNIIGPEVDRSAATQRRLFDLARSLRDPSTAGSRTWRGASARGWALGLTEVGAGPYRVVSAASIGEALAMAARAMSATHRPVGLLVWQGAHAWVMSGFEATGDPVADPTARVTAVRVLDPLYPRAGGSWGPTPAPNARLATALLARVFVPWRPYSRNLALRGRFVLVLPYEPPASRSTRPQPA